MKVLLIDNGSRWLHRLRRLIPGVEIVRRWNDDLGDHSRFDLIVLSGGSLLGLPGTQFEKECSIVRETSRPIIGICLGHQIIAHAFGGTVEEMSEHQRGVAEVSVTEPHDIFANRHFFPVWESHSYAVTDVGKDLIPLARTDHGIAVLKHHTRPVFGFQFHPEKYHDTQFGDEVFTNTLLYLGCT